MSGPRMGMSSMNVGDFLPRRRGPGRKWRGPRGPEDQEAATLVDAVALDVGVSGPSGQKPVSGERPSSSRDSLENRVLFFFRRGSPRPC